MKNHACSAPGFLAHLAWRLHLSEEQSEEAASVIDEWAQDFKEGEYAFSRCESPAERLFLLGGTLIREEDTGYERAGTHLYQLRSAGVDEFDEWQSDDHVADVKNGYWPHMRAQVELLTYRVDFLLERNEGALSRPVRLVVEIDGHDFHERTKEQAAADRARDRRLLAAGYPVIRFTGSEVYKSPDGCVLEALSVFDSLAKTQQEQDDCTRAAFAMGQEKGQRPEEIPTASQEPTVGIPTSEGDS